MTNKPKLELWVSVFSGVVLVLLSLEQFIQSNGLGDILRGSFLVVFGIAVVIASVVNWRRSQSNSVSIGDQ